MVKLAKQYYKLADNSKKINCYHITITKEILNKSNIADDTELNIIPKNKKIIIEEKRN